jgi:tetratricopeptide (TPR) repeat protein
VADTPGELDLPDELFGFTSWLLWLVATRATELVDTLFTAGPARPPTGRPPAGSPAGRGSRAELDFGMADGHQVPTPALLAWLVAAGELARALDVPVAERPGWALRLPGHLAALDAGAAVRLRRRVTTLRTMIPRGMRQPRKFQEGWIGDLAALCGLTGTEVRLLVESRGYDRNPVDQGALVRAIEQTLRSRAADGTVPAAAGGAAAASRALPRDTDAFTGREAELRAVLASARAAGQPGGAAAPRIVVIGGMPGVGKTAFAVHAAHRLAAGFPDGQFFLPLHGHTPGQRAADPADALASLLLMTGTGPGQVPPGLEPRAALWRMRMAGRRVLLVLDDAADGRQADPLLPAGPESMVLITSRQRLAGLDGAETISLDMLSPDEAARLFARLAGRPELTARGAGAADVARIASLCGYLPLAVGMLARQLHHHPSWTPASLAADLAAAGDRLGMLTDPDRSVAAAFDLSDASLPGGLRRLLRRLGLFPGSDIEPWAVAALDGTDPAAARRGLNALYDHYLLTEPALGRFRLHDLVREYAAALAEAEPAADREAALTRLADFYAAAAGAAGRHVFSGGHWPIPAPAACAALAVPAFPDAEAANRWLAAERVNLDAAVRGFAAARPAHAAAILAACHHFLHHGHGDQGVALSSAVLAGAVRAGDLAAQGWAVLGLADFQRGTGDLRAALASTLRAVALFDGAGDQAGQTEAGYHLGWLRYLAGDYGDAAALLQQALAAFRATRNFYGEADTLIHLGYLGYVAGEHHQAAADLELAVKISAENGYADGERSALNQLASVQQEAGDYQAARENFRRALDLCVAQHDRHAEAIVSQMLGYLQCLTGQAADAVTRLERAVAMHREVGNRVGEATALNYLGVAQRLTGNPAAAVASEHGSAALYRAAGLPFGEANALLELGRAQYQLTAGLAEALDATEQALRIFRELDDPVSQAEGRNNIGDFRLAAGDPDGARESYGQALALLADVSVPLERARALEGIARSYPPSARPAAATTQLRQALDIYRRLRSPDAARAQAALPGGKGTGTEAR